MAVIRAANLGVKFSVRKNRRQRLHSLFSYPRGLNGTNGTNEFWALRRVSFEVDEGDVVGVIGANGAGKSTLLRVLAGVYPSDEGWVEVNGRVSPLLSLGAGFRPDLSGRDNVYLSCAFLGMRNKDIDDRFNSIVAFAEVEEFIDAPVRSYSSGMVSRLGFSIAVSVDPDILLIDEILSVGDQRFQEKAQQKMREFMHKAKAVVIATHDMGFVRQSCNQAIWVDRSQFKRIGDPEEVVRAYLENKDLGQKLLANEKTSRSA